jgi:carboxyl-terminal processing protease
VGVTTYGKGSVQLPQTLSDGSILRVTIARWFTPADRTIDGTGLEPDVTVEISDEQLAAGADPQLDKAIELLGGNPAAAPVE